MTVAEVLDALVRPDVVAEDSGRQRQAFFISAESFYLVLFNISVMIARAVMAVISVLAIITEMVTCL